MSGTTLKVILVLSQLIILAGGGVIIYFSLTQMDDYKDLWDYINENLNKYIMYGLCGLGGVNILTGLFGLVGTLKRNRCFLAMFNILAIVLCALFIGVGVAITIFTKNQYQELKDTNCDTTDSNYDWLKQSNQLYNKLGQVYFCSDLCECYVQNKDAFPAHTFENRKTSTDMNKAIRFQECEIAKQDTEYDEYLPLVVFLENKFECSGVCDNVPIYIFTDVNRGSPTYNQGCKVRIQDFYEKYGGILKIISFIAGGFFLLQILFALWLCCSKKSKNHNHNDYYQRVYA